MLYKNYRHKIESCVQNIKYTQSKNHKESFYILPMFPYPSGHGLHIGHTLGYIATDVMARFYTLKGKNVLHPFGFDSFGLPAEQFAIETGCQPKDTTDNNINNMRKQLKSLGLMCDWDREIITSDPDYYKWTQWIFLKLYKSFFDPYDVWQDKFGRTIKGRAKNIETLREYLRKGDWCLDRFGKPIKRIQKTKEMRTTHDSDQNLNISKLDATAENCEFKCELTDEEIEQAIDRARLTYIDYITVNWCAGLGTVLANEEVNPDGTSERGNFPVIKTKAKQWVMRITEYAERLSSDFDKIDWPEATVEMQKNWIGLSNGMEIDFQSDSGIVTVYTTKPETLMGVTFIAKAKDMPGRYALHPITNQRIPILEADYVLSDYGTGYVMGVPAHDERDYKFAKEHSIPIKQAIISYNANQSTDANPNHVTDAKPSQSTNASCSKSVYGSDFYSYNADDMVIIPSDLPIAVECDSKNMSDVGMSSTKYSTESYKMKRVHTDCNDSVEDDNVKTANTHEFAPDDQNQIDYMAGARQCIKNIDNNDLGASHQCDSENKVCHDYRSVSILEFKKWLEKQDFANPKQTSRLKDWIFSRQRYWGEPFPVVHCAKTGKVYPICEDQLPIRLPRITDFKPSSSNTLQTPLSRCKEWMNVRGIIEGDSVRIINEESFEPNSDTDSQNKLNFDPNSDTDSQFNKLKYSHPNNSSGAEMHYSVDSAVDKSATSSQNLKYKDSKQHYVQDFVMDQNTMPNWAGSSWYYLRYIDPQNKNEIFSSDEYRYWSKGYSTVDLYIGGSEHAVLHFLYSRFWHMVLFDLGIVDSAEPYQKVVHQGLITADAYFDKEKMMYISPDKVKLHDNAAFFDGREIVIEKGKMGKRYKNGIDPMDLISEWGVGVLRLYAMYMGPLTQNKPWNSNAIVGMERFCNKICKMMEQVSTSPTNIKTRDMLGRLIDQAHEMYTKITQSHIIIAKMIEFTNTDPILSKEDAISFLKVLAPIEPNIAEYWFNVLKSLHVQDVNQMDDNKIIANQIAHAQESDVQYSHEVEATDVKVGINSNSIYDETVDVKVSMCEQRSQNSGENSNCTKITYAKYNKEIQSSGQNKVMQSSGQNKVMQSSGQNNEMQSSGQILAECKSSDNNRKSEVRKGDLSTTQSCLNYFHTKDKCNNSLNTDKPKLGGGDQSYLYEKESCIAELSTHSSNLKEQPGSQEMYYASIFEEEWPSSCGMKIDKSFAKLTISINGRFRKALNVDVDLREEEAVQIARSTITTLPLKYIFKRTNGIIVLNFTN